MKYDFIHKYYPKDLETRSNNYAHNVELVHACMCLPIEVSEVVDLLGKHMHYNKPYTKKELVKEIGDVIHFVERIVKLTGCDYEEIREAHRDKLTKRFGDAYSDAKAIRKDDEG